MNVIMHTLQQITIYLSLYKLYMFFYKFFINKFKYFYITKNNCENKISILNTANIEIIFRTK